MSLSSSHSFRILAIIIFLMIAATPGVSSAETECFPDGCVTTSGISVGISHLGYSTAAAALNYIYTSHAAAAQGAEVGGGVSAVQYDAAGRITYLACYNGSPAWAAYYNDSTQPVSSPPPPPPAPTCTISVSPTTITKGQSTTVSWSSAHATSFSISPEVGAVGASGSKSVSPQHSTTYSGSASGAGGTVGCASPAVTVLEPSCSITFAKNPIDQGQSTTVHWTSSNATTFYINGIGYVGASGSTSVTPKQSANYSGYVSDDYANTASCPATLQVGGREQVCPPEKILQNGVCVARKQQCPVGYVMQGNACIFAGCPGGYKLVGTQCVLSGKQCTDKPYCQGADLVDGCTGDVLQACDWGCFYGRCNEVPKPSASLKAVPSLVHSGNSTKISWTSTNTTSCTVKSTNGDSWTGKSSLGNSSKPISSQTTFTLVCKGYKNSDPATVQKKVIVNIAPSYQER